MITKEQIEQRVNYLGASEIAAVFGLSRWKTPLQLWAEKTGNLIPDDISNVLQVKLGNRMEEIVSQLFEEETGKKVISKPDTIYHKIYPFLACNLDKWISAEDAVLELKTASAYKLKEWQEQDEIPVEYMLQVMYQMALTGASKGYIACLIGNTNFEIKEIERDEKVFADMIRKCVTFWQDFVVPKVMPMTITPKDSDVLYKLFPIAGKDSVIELDPGADKLIESLSILQEDEKKIKEDIELRKNQLKVMLKTYESGETDLYKISWKEQSTKRIDTKRFKRDEPELFEHYLNETKSRVFRYKIKK